MLLLFLLSNKVDLSINLKRFYLHTGRLANWLTAFLKSPKVFHVKPREGASQDKVLKFWKYGDGKRDTKETVSLKRFLRSGLTIKTGI